MNSDFTGSPRIPSICCFYQFLMLRSFIFCSHFCFILIIVRCVKIICSDLSRASYSKRQGAMTLHSHETAVLVRSSTRTWGGYYIIFLQINWCGQCESKDITINWKVWNYEDYPSSLLHFPNLACPKALTTTTFFPSHNLFLWCFIYMACFSKTKYYILYSRVL